MALVAFAKQFLVIWFFYQSTLFLSQYGLSWWFIFSIYTFVMIMLSNKTNHSHKKRKDNLEGSLDRVLFPTEIELRKIIVPRLPQNSSNINIECTGKSN